ncbi:MAG TPA: DUF1501 domain-containing protein [Planctomycetota bacterium]|jgi:uncharacterized protein (DUF1501 family)|nr:DUF1501 domain-containing protein [Planctomycetota bacterium]
MSQLDRRQVLAGASAVFGCFSLSASDARTGLRLFLPATGPAGDPTPRTLVVLQLSGGNDGLSTVVPYGDDVYNRSRTATRIDGKDVLRIDGYRGLHPELKKLKSVYDQGQLAIVEGCGYPEPIRSHFRSMEVWHTAQARGRSAGEGWIGKLCDAAYGKESTAEFVVHIGASAPYSVYSVSHPAIAFATPEGYRWVSTDRDDLKAYRASSEKSEGSHDGRAVLDRLRGVLAEAQESSIKIRRAAAGYKPKAEYPQDEFGNSLRAAAAVIDARIGTRVLSIELGGFDSHNNQRNQHDDRMRRLDAGLGAFLEDLRGTSAGDHVVVVAFSEFGRRVKENGSGGTDHGVAAPMFVAGTKVHGGLHGKHPSMTDLKDGDLVHTTDFRSVYGTLIDEWLGVDSSKVLDARYPRLAIV